ncbi:MAG: DUF3866 family protein [Bacillota bacterium]|nr:DUF3866 family protein [Bacillota bacterium]
MISIESGQVINIIVDKKKLQKLEVLYQNGESIRAILYKQFAPAANVGDKVLANRTAGKLKLGTGGFDFIVANLTNPDFTQETEGHIMKLRYTPLQVAIKSVEEDVSNYHELFEKNSSLAGFPVIIGSLHSMVAPAVIGAISSKPNVRIAYIMTDGASLPLAFSETVADLMEKKLIMGTITYGHAFGGDLEAVNVYTALLAAKYCLKADLAIVAMGPGIVGTSTIFGHTGVEQGEIANAVASLEGTPIIVPRISFLDPRPRHQGFSHHTVTVLTRICRAEAIVSMPELKDLSQQLIQAQLKVHNLTSKYKFFAKESSKAMKLAADLNLHFSTMGRDAKQESIFFEAAIAAGIIACELT